MLFYENGFFFVFFLKGIIVALKGRHILGRGVVSQET